MDHVDNSNVRTRLVKILSTFFSIVQNATVKDWLALMQFYVLVRNLKGKSKNANSELRGSREYYAGGGGIIRNAPAHVTIV